MPRKNGNTNRRSSSGSKRSSRLIYDEYEDMSIQKTGGQSVRLKQKLKYKNESQKIAIETIRENVLTFLSGCAGTSKSFLAVASAVDMFVSGEVEKIVISRPTVAAGFDIGYLPGDVNQKLNPYLLPLLDHFEYFVGKETTAKMMEEGLIEVCAIQHMRGRNFNNCCIVIDEAQNSTKEQLKLALTRIGENSKCIVTFDERQVDLRDKNDSCVSDIERFVGVDKIGFFKFKNKDVVRSEICSIILKVYDEN